MKFFTLFYVTPKSYTIFLFRFYFVEQQNSEVKGKNDHFQNILNKTLKSGTYLHSVCLGQYFTAKNWNVWPLFLPSIALDGSLFQPLTIFPSNPRYSSSQFYHWSVECALGLHDPACLPFSTKHSQNGCISALIFILHTSLIITCIF